MSSGQHPYSHRYSERTVRHPDSVLVWDTFVFHGVGKLVVLLKSITLNKERYLELLADHLENCFMICLSEGYQQDRVPALTDKLVTGWLNFGGTECIRDWPGNSPDLSSIENLWAVMKAQLRQHDTSCTKTCWFPSRHLG